MKNYFNNEFLFDLKDYIIKYVKKRTEIYQEYVSLLNQNELRLEIKDIRDSLELSGIKWSSGSSEK